jgi:hypothetical protein
VDPQGAGLAGQRVTLVQGDRPVAVADTNDGGYFALRAGTGMYAITVAGGMHFCRVWNASVAPPAARQGVLIVVGGPTVRGQGWYEAMAQRPMLTYTLIAAAIVVPVATLGATDHHPASQ